MGLLLSYFHEEALQLDPNEVKEIRAAFELFDRNKDGHISATEIKEVLTNLGIKPSDGEVRQLIKEADRDGSGTIDWDEFLKAMTATKTKMNLTDKEYMEAFKVFDKDGDGMITKEELRTVVSNLGLSYIYSEDVIKHIFSNADANHDGKISRDEFLDAMKKGL